MKASVVSKIAFVGAIIVGIAGGHPHKLKRDIATEVTYTTVNVANVVVWVDGNGVPYQTETIASTVTTPAAVESTSTTVQTVVVASAASAPSEQGPAVTPAAVITEAGVAASATPAPAEPSSKAAETSAIPEPAPSSAPPQQAPPPQAPEQPASPKPSPEPRPVQSSDDGSLPIGVTYDPFKPGACKTEAEVTADWEQMKKYGIVRTYGMGCGIIPLAVKLANANNQKIFAGIWTTNDDSSEDVDTVVKEITSAVRDFAGGNWNIIQLVSVENERVNDKALTASAVVDTINRARQALRFAGYNGPVGAVETVPAMLDNPTICENSDVALVNVHPYFDTNCKAEDAGKFVQDRVAEVKRACNKRVIVTESGWPHQGDSHGAAVASPEAQKAAMGSLLSVFDHDLFFHNAFDSGWKTDWAGSFNAERYWGIFQG